jgi:hypothetical protein
VNLEPRTKGPVRLLCDEIDFPFQQELETTEVFVSFVRMLVSNIEEARCIQAAISHVTGKSPSDGSQIVLDAAVHMLAQTETRDLISNAAHVHNLAHEYNPEDAYPTDHLIDMLSSCASAIRFGLETPCRSRHAAEAAAHVWKNRYGISREDELTGAWRKDWARTQLQRAIIFRMAALGSAP